MAHRYWRLLCTYAGTLTGFYEIEMRATSGGADQTSAGFAIESGHRSVFAATLAFDDNLGNNWQAPDGTAGDTAWVGQDFGAATTVAEITCYEGNPVLGPSAISIQYSDDGSIWTTTDTYSGLTWDFSETKTFAVTDAAGGSDVAVAATSGAAAAAGSSPTVIASAHRSVVASAGVISAPGAQAFVNVGANTSVRGTAGSVSLAGSDATVAVGVPETVGPIATDVAGGWHTNVGGTDLATVLDEETANDTDFIRSANDPSGDVCRVKFDTLPNTSFVAPLTLSYRIGKSGPGVVTTTVRLKQGDSVIASWVHTDDALTTYNRSIDPAEISDFADLHLEFEAA